jgi:hypothetical protein
VVVVYVYNPSYTGGIRRSIMISSQSSPGKNERPHLKNNRKQKGMGASQVVEHLPSKHKALSLNPRTRKKKNVAQ